MELAPPFGQDRFMTNTDDDLPRPVRQLLVPPVLDMLGVEELQAYIGLLEGEILRVKQAISKKQAHKHAAAAFFKVPPGG